MSPKKILTIALTTVGALALVSRVAFLRKLVLNRARTIGPVTAGPEATVSAEGVITLGGF